MMFTLGDLLVLGVAVIVVLIFRRLDRNNRSLEKVKRYGDRVQQDLTGIAEEKSQQLKDISIGVEVHQQSARKAIEQLEASAEELNQRARHIDEIQHRIDQYDLALKQLVEMTNKAEGNIKGIQKESAYVDTVGRRLKNAQKRIEDIEKSIPAVMERFMAGNQKQLESISRSALEESRQIAGELNVSVGQGREEAENLMQLVENQITGFRDELNGRSSSVLAELQDTGEHALENLRRNAGELLDDLQSRVDILTGEMHDLSASARGEIQSSFEKNENQLLQSEEDFKERMNEIAAKARKFELKAFEDLNSELASVRGELTQSFDESMREREASVRQRLASFGNLLDQTDDGLKDKLGDFTQEVEERLSVEFQSIEQRSTELHGDIDRRYGEINAVLQKNDERIHNKIAEQELSLDHKVEIMRSVLLQTDDGLKDKLGDFTQEVKERLSVEFQSIEQRSTELQGDVDRRYGEINAVLQKNDERIHNKIAEQELGLDQKVETIRSVLLQTDDGLKDKLGDFTQEVEERLSVEFQSIQQRSTELQGDIDRRYGEITAVLQKNDERIHNKIAEQELGLEQKVETIRSALLQTDDGLKDKLRDFTQEVEERLSGEFQSIQQRSTELQGDIDRRYGEITAVLNESDENFQRKTGEQESSVQQWVEEFRASVRQSDEGLKGQLRDFTQEVEERLSSRFQAIDNRWREFQGDINQRYETLNTVLNESDENFQRKIGEQESSVEQRVEEFRESVRQTDDGFKQSMGEFVVQVDEKISSEIQSIQDKSLEYQNDISSRYEELNALLEENSGDFRIKLRDQSDEVDTRIYQLEQEVQAKLEESKSEGSAIADRILNQISMDMEARGESLKSTVQKQLEELDSRVKLSHNQIDSSFTELRDRLDSWMEKSNGYVSELESQFSHLNEKSVQIEQEYSQRIESIESEMARTEAEASSRFENLKEDNRRLANETSERINADIQASTSRSRQDLESRYQELESLVEEARGEAYRQLEGLNEQIGNWSDSFSSKISSTSESNLGELRMLGEQLEEQSTQLMTRSRRGQEELASQFREMLAAQKETLDGELENSGNEIQRIQHLDRENQRKISEIDVSLQNSLDELSGDLKNRHNELESKIAEETLRVEQQILGEIEKRLVDYEGNINYRLSRLESVSGELDGLNSRIRESIAVMEESLRGEMDEISEQLHRERSADLELARNELGQLSSEIQNHAHILAELKETSEANIEEQLKVLEQGFFGNLREQGQNLDARLENWAEEFEKTLDRIRKDSEEERINLEKRYIDDFASRLENLRGGMSTRIDELQSEFRDRESIMREDLSMLGDKLGATKTGVEIQLDEIKVQSAQLIESRYQSLEELLAAREEEVKNQMDTSIRSIHLNINEQGTELQGLHEAVRSDVTLWQNQILQRLKSTEHGVDEQMSGLRIQTDEIIAGIKEHYSQERDGIVAEGEEARMRLQSGIQEASVQLTKLRNELGEKSEEALERFNADYQSYMDEFISQSKEISREIDGTIRDFRGFVAQTREEFDGSQRRLMDKLGEDIRVLEVNLREIEKKQKGFLQQTKLFERADNLRRGLTEDLTQLKGEIDRVQTERKQLNELEGNFTKIRKLGDEATGKLNKFIGEQKRLEGIEDNYKKLISLSQNVDSRLDKVTAKHDHVQQIEFTLRNLDELQKELDQRYERLTKRKEIIDTTLEGVDRNFHQLTDLENRISEMNQIMGGVNANVNELKNRMESMALNKKESDMAMRNIQNLNQIMDELENRMDAMQKAREWLARTETRLEEVSVQANQQVEILGSLAGRQRDASQKEEKSAPSVSVRDMVIKLKHQGWKIEDIAKSCKISRGEVELILEMAHS